MSTNHLTSRRFKQASFQHDNAYQVITVSDMNSVSKEVSLSLLSIAIYHPFE